MGSDFSDTFGNFMKGVDVPPNKDFELTIAGAGVQEFNAMGAATGANKQRKLVLSFRETTKMMVCNATNARTIGDAYGCNTDYLPGKKIRVSRVVTNMGPGIMVRCPAPPAQSVAGDPFAQAPARSNALMDPPPAATDPLAQPPANDFDEDIPFS